MDKARRWTDEQLESLERRMQREYKQASREMQDKLKVSLADYDRERKARLASVGDSAELKEQYDGWLRDQVSRHEWMRGMVEELSEAATNANERAIDALNDAIPTIYSENANRAAYDIDRLVKRDTQFTLVNETTVRSLIQGQDREFLKEVGVPKVDRPKDLRWNRRKFNSALTQGILQGESIQHIVDRTNHIFGSNHAAAVRAARTATTSAENAGTHASFERANKIGIPLVQQWVATVDVRTRASHIDLDGEQIEIGQVFSNGLRYPGDPQGSAAEVYNCRCALRAHVKGFEDSKQQDRWINLPEGMTYDDWKDWRHGDANSQRIMKGPKRTKVALDIYDYERDTGTVELEARADKEICDKDSYYVETVATFTPCEVPNRPPDHESGSNSRYWYTPEGVIRQSDHWGTGVASCSWYMEGVNELRAYTTYDGAGLARAFGTNEAKAENLVFGQRSGFCRWGDFTKKTDVIGGIDQDSVDAISTRCARNLKNIGAAQKSTQETLGGQMTPNAFIEQYGGRHEVFTSKKGKEMVRLSLPNGEERTYPISEMDKPQQIRWTVKVDGVSIEESAKRLSKDELNELNVMYRNGYFAGDKVLREIAKILGW